MHWLATKLLHEALRVRLLSEAKGGGTDVRAAPELHRIAGATNVLAEPRAVLNIADAKRVSHTVGRHVATPIAA